MFWTIPLCLRKNMAAEILQVNWCTQTDSVCKLKCEHSQEIISVQWGFAQSQNRIKTEDAIKASELPPHDKRPQVKLLNRKDGLSLPVCCCHVVWFGALSSWFLILWFLLKITFITYHFLFLHQVNISLMVYQKTNRMLWHR